MGSLPVFVEVNDKYLWTLAPFAYLFNLFWSELQPVTIAGYSRPEFSLPPNFNFHQIATSNYPADRWSNGMMEFLDSQSCEHFVFLLCDYWLARTVDVRGVLACYEYIKDRPEVLRIDLTEDRLWAGGMVDVESYGSYDIIETPSTTPYQFSTQAGIWNRYRMLELLELNKSAWEVEIQTAVPEKMRVLGTRQASVRYANALLKGELDPIQLMRIPEPHRSFVFRMIPPQWSKVNE